MNRRLLGIGMGVAGMALLAALWLSRTRATRDSETPAEVPVPSTTAVAEHAAAPSAAATPASAMTDAPPDLWLPSHALRDHLDAARAGDAEAMLRVGRALRECVDYIADPEGTKLQEERERAFADLRARDAPGEADGTGVFAHWNDRFARRFATHADCIAIGAERIATGLQWIERAAHAGNTAAKLEYARGAFAEFPDGNAMLANLDEVARRRDLARAWAMQALEAGERGAIDVLARAYYGETGLFPRDYQRGAPYAMAQEMLMARSSEPDRFRRLYDRGPEREAYAWGNDNAWVHDDAAWQAALERAREIVDLVSGERPGG